jgi:hypothetical protein
VPNGVLRSHDWRVEKYASADSIAREPKDIQQREVREKAFRRASLVIKPWLRVEGERPGCEIEPATESCRSVSKVAYGVYVLDLSLP